MNHSSPSLGSASAPPWTHYCLRQTVRCLWRSWRRSGGRWLPESSTLHLLQHHPPLTPKSSSLNQCGEYGKKKTKMGWKRQTGKCTGFHSIKPFTINSEPDKDRHNTATLTFEPKISSSMMFLDPQVVTITFEVPSYKTDCLHHLQVRMFLEFYIAALH